ncbi:haloacid dehalogenase-like hydrolase [Desulfobulbus oligotrophicus]|uniref:Haloacid dehalogenase-like hydrolase n=1 Tax=Desulfobulbus oligotrophicus TaxID=1909699 RepID=A0A7T6AQC9_9BACT|nr:haloacid dehalogenase-like hydrolase [Desulfobulbus oligotrophicus]QQG65360.1 haloacid dehalogenase-like hydrolase [Desulfobulbus oligotrophicus]
MISSATTPQTSAETPDSEENWFPENLARIMDWLATVTTRPQANEPVAVFDFDNTCIFRDIGQAVFRFQLQRLQYRLIPEQLAAILPRADIQLAGRPLPAIVATLIETYQTLFPLLIFGRNKQALRLPQAELFTTLLLWFTDQARKDDRLGPRFVLPFMAKLLAGFTTDELRFFAIEVVQAAQAEPLVEEWMRTEAPDPIGPIETSFPLGLHLHPEMLALMHRLAAQGVERYVISASAEWLVEGAVRWLGFPIPADHIYGIRVGLDSGEVLTIKDPSGYPVTYREGKAAIIAHFLNDRPLLVAGDADTDYEMLTLPTADIRLLINRRQSGLISSLYTDPRILLQGLDLTNGRFRPSRETIG